MTLGDKVAIYNNHANQAGDDIYSTGTITIPSVASGKNLDESIDAEHNCNNAIDGWYEDGKESVRWNTHEEDSLHADAIDAGSYSEVLALKAAHGIITDEVFETTDLILTKTNAANGNALAGATFELSDGENSVTVTTDANGQATLEDLEIGKPYTLTETVAPSGYQAIEGTVATITVNGKDPDTKNVTRESEGSNKNEVVAVTTYAVDGFTVDGISAVTQTENGLTVTNTAIPTPQQPCRW